MQGRHTGSLAADRKPHLLLTGQPGVGKTTLIRELTRRLAAHHPAGFYTEEIRSAQGIREGFRLETLCGRALVLSHIRHFGPHRVGRYGVDVAGFERLLEELDLHRSPSPLVMIDEIGKMECYSPRFISDVTRLLDGPKPVVATIALKGRGFIREVKQRRDCRLVTVTRDNRDRLANELERELELRLAQRARPGCSTAND